MATEQEIYEFLARIDHPVFPKDMAAVTDEHSPFNSVMNRLVAKAFVRLQAAIDSLSANSFPHTCDEKTIDRWEQTYFGFTKTGQAIETRKAELLVKINTRLTMSEPDAKAVALAITGQTPEIIRSIWSRGWVIGQSAIGRSTVIASGTSGAHSTVYVLIFKNSIDSKLKRLLDRTLTQIEKGGSRHSIVAPIRLWVIGRSAIGVDTTIG